MPVRLLRLAPPPRLPRLFSWVLFDPCFLTVCLSLSPLACLLSLGPEVSPACRGSNCASSAHLPLQYEGQYSRSTWAILFDFDPRPIRCSRQAGAPVAVLAPGRLCATVDSLIPDWTGLAMGCVCENPVRAGRSGRADGRRLTWESPRRRRTVRSSWLCFGCSWP